MPCVDVNFDTGTDTFYETPEAIQSYFQCAAGEGIVGLQFGRMFHYEKVGKSKNLLVDTVLHTFTDSRKCCTNVCMYRRSTSCSQWTSSPGWAGHSACGWAGQS